MQVIELDNGLRHYAQVIKEYTNMDISQLPGAGAAGGMGGGLLPFLNAELQSGIEVILKTLRFEEVVRQADLILTGLVWEKRWTESYVSVRDVRFR